MIKSPIRILQIVPNMQSGGLENLIMNIYRNIDKSKVQFDFLVHYTEKKHFDDEIEKMGGRIYRFDLRDNNNILKYMIELNKFYKEHKEYKVIHCHMSSIGFINFIIAGRNGIKVRIAHSHNSATDKTFKGILKGIMIKPYKYASTINYACSTEAGNFLFGKKEFEFLPNAVDTSKYKFDEKERKVIRKKLNIGEDCFVIGHIGRFNVQKNHKFIIDIFSNYYKKNKNSYLLLIGDGELKTEIEEYARSKGCFNNIFFTGVLCDAWKYYNAMDVFVLPSLFEGLPVVGVEAQANGLRCIFSDVITKEVDVTGLITYLPLEIKTWVNNMKSCNTNVLRGEYADKVKQSDFEITKLSKKIESKYINLYNNQE